MTADSRVKHRPNEQEVPTEARSQTQTQQGGARWRTLSRSIQFERCPISRKPPCLWYRKTRLSVPLFDNSWCPELDKCQVMWRRCYLSGCRGVIAASVNSRVNLRCRASAEQGGGESGSYIVYNTTCWFDINGILMARNISAAVFCLFGNTLSDQWDWKTCNDARLTGQITKCWLVLCPFCETFGHKHYFNKSTSYNARNITLWVGLQRRVFITADTDFSVDNKVYLL